MKKKQFDLSTLIFLIIIIPFYKPGYFDDIVYLDIFTNIIRVLFSLIIVFLFFQNRKSYSKAFIFLLLFEGTFLVSTLYNGLSLYTFVKNNVLQIAIYMLFTLYSYKFRDIVKILYVIGEILTYANLLTVALFPNGLYVNITNNWLLGYKNYYLPFFIGFIIVSLLYNHYVRFSIRPYILIATMLATLYVVESITSLVVMLLFLVLILILRSGKSKILNPYTFSAINIILYFMVVVFRTLDYFSVLIVDIFHKNLTLSGRTRIWDSVINLIFQKPILGWGLLSYDESKSLIGLTTGTHAHNIILQYWYTGGIISLIFFMLFNVYILKKLYQYKETYTAKVLSVAIFLYYIACLTETYSNALTYIMFALADNVEYLIPFEHGIEDNWTHIRIVVRKKALK